MGVDAASAMGEPLTQSTLNSFHSSGTTTASVTTGVPRFIELLNASKNQKRDKMDFQLLKPLSDLQIARDICRNVFEEKYIDEVLEKQPEIIYKLYDNLSENDKRWYTFFDKVYHEEYRERDWCVRLTFNKDFLFQYKQTTQIISNKIEDEYKGVMCVFSPINIIDVYIDTSVIDSPSVILALKNKSKKKKEKEIVLEQKRELITEENKDYYYMKGVVLEHLLDIKLTGIEGISKVYYKNINNIWNLETSGTNMRKTMNHPDVDFRTVVSNNMWEIFNVLGIEAARSFLIKEITTAISSGGGSIDIAHPTLLVDSMTHTGTILAVNRYGIKQAGVLTTASFEQSHQKLLEAPIKGMIDDLNNVSTQIIMGEHMRVGTNYFDVFTDLKKLKSKKNLTNKLEKLTLVDKTVNVFKGDVVEKDTKNIKIQHGTFNKKDKLQTHYEKEIEVEYTDF